MGRSAVSLDLGSSAIRAALFTVGKTVTIDRLATVPLSPGVIEKGEIRDSQALTDAIRGLWEEHKFGTKHVHFSIGNAQVLTRIIEVDWLPEDEFRQALKYMAEDHLPRGKGDEYTLDYHVLAEYDVPGETEDDAPARKRQIVLVAIPSAHVETYIKAIRDAGLLPIQANLTPFALIQAAAAANGTGAEALIDIGDQVTTIVVHEGGQPRFVRTISGQGGGAITQALVERFQWSIPDAEGTKIELGLNTGFTPAPAPVDSVFGTDAVAPVAPTEHPAHAVINQVAANLITEARQSVEFALNGPADVRGLSRVVLSGGASLLKGLAQRLASELRVQVEYTDPLKAVTLSKKAEQPPSTAAQQWAVTVGTALGAQR